MALYNWDPKMVTDMADDHMDNSKAMLAAQRMQLELEQQKQLLIQQKYYQAMAQAQATGISGLATQGGVYGGIAGPTTTTAVYPYGVLQGVGGGGTGLGSYPVQGGGGFGPSPGGYGPPPYGQYIPMEPADEIQRQRDALHAVIQEFRRVGLDPARYLQMDLVLKALNPTPEPFADQAQALVDEYLKDEEAKNGMA